MKKLCLLLALVMALCCVPAMAAEGDAILGHNDDNTLYFNYSFTVGDTLYMVAYGSLYSYRVGDADLVEYTYDIPESEDEEVSYDVSVMPFSSGDGLYALNLVTRYGENTEFDSAKLVSLTLGEDGTVQFEDVCDLDWSDLVEYYDNNSYPVRPDSILGAAGKALIRYYDPQGDYKLSTIDLNSGEIEEVSELKDAYCMTPYRDGALLVEQYNYEKPDTARLMIYDPADESIQTLAEITVDEHSPLNGLAYDAGSDTVYCTKGGEICPVDLAAGKVGEGVTDMPLDVYGASTAFVLEGGYYAYCSEGAVIRNLDPAQKAKTRLKINDSSWSDSVSKAYYRFVNTHGDVGVVLSRDYNESVNLIEKMMNRDDSIDVYVMSAATTVYDALYNRGYLMELDGSQKAMELAERMYPALRECLSVDGHLVALPVVLNSSTLGINAKALEALGLSMADVPEDWGGFLDFLAGLPDKLDGTKVKLFYSGYDADDARSDLFNSIFEDYSRYINANDPAMGYNTELLRGLLAKLEQIDFVALGCAESSEDEENQGGYIEYSDDELVLLQTSVGCSIGNFYSDYTPVLMRVDPDVPANLVLDATVAFVNPFTKNPEAALAFIDELVDDLSLSTLYCLTPDRNETIRGESNQEVLDDATSELAALKAEYEQASPEEKQSLELEIRNAEENLEYIESNLWDVSPVELEWYRAHDDNIVISNYNWLYSDSVGEATDLIEQYQGGQITVKEMLEGIDKKVQMMLLEGN